MEASTTFVIVAFIYIAIIIFYGFYQGKKVKSNSDFSIAGRKLPGWVASLSERATGESSWALLGLPGAAYATGLLEIWTAVGCVLGVIIAWIFLAGKIRDEAEKYDVTTFTDYLAKRHGRMGRHIRTVSSLAIVFFFFFYVGAQFIGGAKTLENILGIEQFIGMLLIFILVVPYTIYGGFRSVTYTDVIQAILMVIAVVVTPIVGFIYLSNQPESTIYAPTIGKALEKAGHGYSSLTGGIKLEGTQLYSLLSSIFPNSLSLVTGLGAGIMVVSYFSWFFGYLGGQPQLTTRFMAIADKKQSINGRNIGIIWTILAYTGAILVGYIGIAIFGPNALSDHEKIMPTVIYTLFHPLIASFLIMGILAAIISTANSLLILSATELSDNIIIPWKQSKLHEVNSLKISRWITAFLAIVALILAYFSPTKIIYSIVSIVWAGIGGTYSVVILYTLFWKKFHARAALIAIIFGLSFTILWVVTGGEKVLPTRLLTFPLTALIGWIVTRISREN